MRKDSDREFVLFFEVVFAGENGEPKMAKFIKHSQHVPREGDKFKMDGRIGLIQEVTINYDKNCFQIKGQLYPQERKA